MADLSISKLANPGPLGLGGFALTTFVLNVHNAGIVDIGAALPLGLFYGGLAQLVAGFLEFQTGNTFGMTAFTSYGLFWIALATLLILPKAFPTLTATTPGGLGAMMVMWGLFTGVMFIGTLRLNGALMVVFGSLTVLFALLAWGFFSGNANITHIAGYEGIFCGASAMYAGLAQVLNEVYGRTVLPLCPVKK